MSRRTARGRTTPKKLHAPPVGGPPLAFSAIYSAAKARQTSDVRLQLERAVEAQEAEIAADLARFPEGDQTEEVEMALRHLPPAGTF